MAVEGAVATQSTRALDLALIAGALGLVAGVHALLFGIYRPWNIDTPWFLSFARNLCVAGERRDVVFGLGLPDGLGGTVLFGRLPALLHCAVAGPLGWSPAAARLVSLASLLASCGALYAFLRRTGAGAAFAGSVVTALAIAEPFVGLADQPRYEFFAFLLAALALALHAHDRLVLAAFAATLAIEAHPMGLAAVLYLGAAELARFRAVPPPPPGRGRAVRLLLGAALGAAAYVLLHPGFADEIAALLRARPGRGGHFLYPYFFEARYLRHLPELAVLAFAAVAWALARPAGTAFAGTATLAILVVGFLLNWPNYNYTVYWYFPALLLAFQVASQRVAPVLLAAGFAVYMLPQYGYAAWLNHDARDAAWLDEARAILAAPDLEAPDVPVYGHFGFWVAFHERRFRWDGRLLRDGAPAERPLVVICQDQPAPRDAGEPTCARVLAPFPAATERGRIRAPGGHLFRVVRVD